MATNFETYEQMLREQTDAMLGDVIEFMIPPATEFVALKGYVVRDEPGMDAAGPADPLNTVQRVKIRKDVLGVRPNRQMRFRAAKLEGGATALYQVAGNPHDPEDGYWLLDVQKVAA